MNIFYIQLIVLFLLWGCHRSAKNERKIIEKEIFTDKRDGKVYKTIKINDQVWMAENLDYNADSSWCLDSIQSGILKKRGRFYSFAAVEKVCPYGWHIPNKREWQKLLDFYGGLAVAGGKLKDTIGWKYPNTGATNSSGFSVLPAGYFDIKEDTFFLINENANFWCQQDSNLESYISIYYDDTSVIQISPYKKYGLCVRCIKDS